MTGVQTCALPISSDGKVRAAGLKVASVADAVKGADFVMILMPDEHIAAAYKADIEPNLKEGAVLAFAHGFNIHYGQVQPRADLDVVMVAPKAPGGDRGPESRRGHGERSYLRPYPEHRLEPATGTH